MVDHRLVFAAAGEEEMHRVVARYAVRLDEVNAQKGMMTDPDAPDAITDETLRDRLFHGAPKVPVFSLPDISKAQQTGTGPVTNFMNVEGISYVGLRDSQMHTLGGRFDDGEVETRLEYMGSFAVNHGTVAVIDGQGEMFIARATDENINFLTSHGYSYVDREFPVPFSNAETPIGLNGKLSYNVHIAVGEFLGRTSMSFKAFQADLSSLVEPAHSAPA